MNILQRNRVIGLFVYAMLLFSVSAQAIPPVYTTFFSNLALSGYDPVAYFAEGKPVKGKSEFQTKYKGATWQFSSKDHLDRFKAMPEKYAPQYGGYCAWAVAHNKKASGDPNQWTIVNGKLYLNYDAGIQAKWRKEQDKFIALGDDNWPELLKK